ncbi:MAG: rod shape-determining protein RodA [Candidatus Pacebacteria bacterium]|nr:rod shape-determining protein RodA [Candidatus Paceibacterota bacterium]
MAIIASLIGRRRQSFTEKLVQMPWGLVIVVTILCVIGLFMLYSAAAGNFDPWASKQLVRFAIGMVLMLGIATVPIRFWYRASYVIYALALILLVVVKFQGSIGMGAQRWLDFGFVRVQPSEIMKYALIMALARFFDQRGSDGASQWLALVIPLILLAAPVGLIAVQPDLGTAVILIMACGMIFFTIGISWWVLGGGILTLIAAAPLVWHYLHDYQKARVLVFLDSSRDPLGTGYNIIQSKIAIGSGGWTGKGFMQGTQSHLNFLPEKQTDFIFTMLGEEFGFLGAIFVLCLYGIVLLYGYRIVSRVASRYARIVAIGIIGFMFLSIFVNVGMVMGMIPAKGVPLPFLSYGGTSLVVTLCGMGLLMNLWIHRDARLGAGGVED